MLREVKLAKINHKKEKVKRKLQENEDKNNPKPVVEKEDKKLDDSSDDE